jgi:NADPH:quinone reductase-like Zn-dependent oxidoreductase
VIEDGELVVEERPEPVPGPGEVLVAVRAAGVNAADLLQRRGLYPAPAGAPADVPGLELSGVVRAHGEGVSPELLGRRVMAVVAGGAQAEACSVHASHLLAVPDSLGDLEAGGFAEAFVTAHDALVTRGGLRPGARVLITGAAGGVGSAGVQLAAALGAEVVASVRDPARRDEVEAMGASVAIDPASAAEHGPYDLVLELVGAASLASGVLGALATDATVVVIGVGGGSRIELDLLSLMGARASICGATLRPRSVEEKAAATEAVRRDVLPLLEAGRLHVPVLASYPLTEVSDAYARFSDGSKLGKIILDLAVAP